MIRGNKTSTWINKYGRIRLAAKRKAVLREGATDVAISIGTAFHEEIKRTAPRRSRRLTVFMNPGTTGTTRPRPETGRIRDDVIWH